MADISTGRQRGIVPFVDETTGRLPDSYLPQGVIDLQGDLEQAVLDASQSATAAQQSASQAQSNATAAGSAAQAAAASAESAQTATESAASSKDAAAQSASEASESAQAAEALKTSAASSASAAEASKTNAAASASAAETSETNAAASATAAQRAVEGFGLEVGTTTTGEPGSDASVTIQKNGTKYTANFTIPTGQKGPKGDPGDLTTVTHDDTLTGDGTSSAPLGAAVGSALNQGITNEPRDLDFNTYTSSGIYGITSNGLAQNAPSEMKSENIRAALLVSQCGFNARKGVVLQVLFTRNVQASQLGIYMRGLRSGTWDEWLRIAPMSDIRNASALTSRIAALEAESNELAVMRTRLQALEARIKSLETN